MKPTPTQDPLDIAFLRLSQEWEREFAKLAPNRPPRREMDLRALSSMLIAVEHVHSLSNESVGQIAVCLKAAAQRPLPWVDSLPWQIAQDAVDGRIQTGLGIDFTMENLTHDRSALRIWAMEVAWLVRNHLDRNTTLPLLLQNVANTLAGVDRAWGLAGSLFEDAEQLFWAAEDWTPEDYHDQYSDRLQQLKKYSLVISQAPFWKLEAKCRKLIIRPLAAPKQLGFNFNPQRKH